MSPAGWAIMALSVGLMVILTAYCFFKILSEKPHEHEHIAPIDIDTHDREE